MARPPARKPASKKAKKSRAPRAAKAARKGKVAAKVRARTKKAVRKPAISLPAVQRLIVDRIIVADGDVAEGVAMLRAACPVMRKVHEVSGHPPLRRREAGFEGLARIIVGQQLSVASAAAIWARTFAAVTPFTPAQLLALSDGDLAKAGLSRPKIRTLRAISEACASGLDLVALAKASDEEVHARLTGVNGIGPWTADIYLMFCLGRADAWAPGDLALQVAAQHAFGLESRPTRDELFELAERWRPWRAVAARLLWAYYAVTKQQRTAIPV